MVNWSNWLVILAVGAAAGWCIRWVHGAWNRSGTLCACDWGACPAARKLETLVRTAANLREHPNETIALSEEDLAGPASN